MSEIKELLEVSKEILKWIKFANFEKVKIVLINVLGDDNRKLVYYFSDGLNTSEIIVSKTSVSSGSVSNWWRSWAKLGIIELLPVKGGGFRGKKIFELSDFDIPIPKVPEEKPKP
jgi:hypothetical protein